MKKEYIKPLIIKNNFIIIDIIASSGINRDVKGENNDEIDIFDEWNW